MRLVPAFLVVALLCCASISCTIWENPPKGWAGATGGEHLDRMLWQEIARQNWGELRKHLAENFSLTTSSGSFGPEQALEHWRQLGIQEYSLGEFQVKPNGPDMVVIYTMTRAGSPQTERVMSVWQEVGPRWILIAHSALPAQQQP
jgi:hypothetical protein